MKLSSRLLLSLLLLAPALPQHASAATDKVLIVVSGEGKDAGGYTSKEAMRMGIPLTAVVFVVVLVEAAWFHLFGLM